jgi:hypothetical protein
MSKSKDVAAAPLHGIVHRGESVWLVGERIGDKTADVYASRKDAEDAILGYIFDDEDEHWIGKLNAEQRCILWTLKTNNTAFDVILSYYNSVAEDKWVLVEACLR